MRRGLSFLGLSFHDSERSEILRGLSYHDKESEAPFTLRKCFWYGLGKKWYAYPKK